ncbi:hypothetical protein BDY17DRAFT_72623 [Neohortaea acidophila]|uniref:Secreted protein n=1 Tax=Neohortaea acidophila TaxID=245834 RepID=A0A6A6Q2D5_9PEZI|nr:uncharacterized protein BDY17DRAFT_72623 [Neohortaea acidophila]KAF2486191.1 hypothetical protein BDY17DRAFT_72623 [Neohortaea acidophila]
MKLILLCLTLCATAQAVPVLVSPWSVPDPKHGKADPAVGSKEVTHFPPEDDAESISSHYMTSQASTPTTDTEPECEQDPELMEILGHVDDILASDLPADEQVPFILDAILHHTESLQQHAWYLGDVENDVDKAPAHASSSSPEKMQRMFRAILERTEDSIALDRIRAILSETNSLHKKINKILAEIADDLGLTVDVGWSDGAQVPLTIADHD